MLSRINTVSFRGIDTIKVTVEVQIARGLPSFSIVGLADKAVAESKERVRAAMEAIGLALPSSRITVNLAPADVTKEGSYFDLPIALALLCAMNILPAEELCRYTVMGELGLDGRIAPVSGILPGAVAANSYDNGFICPAVQGSEALWSNNPDIIAAPSLLDLINHFKGIAFIAPPELKTTEAAGPYLDLKDVKGQETAKRALEIAAAGGHNLLMIGPPGSGKSMLAARLPGILPPMTAEEILEVSMIHSVAGLLKDGSLITKRPFRDPHHSASMPALTGGGLKAKPGEVSLAHRGVLFLDELPEFQRATLEALRQPLETGKVSVARANVHVTYPARFQLVAAMNPCRCGYLGVPGHECQRAPKCAAEYQAKLSGPLLDRIDLHVDVPSVLPYQLAQIPEGETSETVAKRVLKAVDIQRARYQGLPISRNAEADGPLLENVAALDASGQACLIKAAEQMNLSARGYHRILRVARTIADLAGEEKITVSHISEALSLRRITYNGA